MITFISGLPGHGKTLYTIDFVRKYVQQEYKDAIKQAESEGKPVTEVEKRPVYQHGINGLKLQWHELGQVEDWHTLPVGSIIVIDEAQKHFPAMSNSAKRPRHYTEFDTHRHSGYDIFLITQDPVNVDVRPRSMSERHFHVSRSFGVKAATLYEFQSVQLVSSERYKRIESSIKKQWKYPEDVFALYKSAEVHTHKRRLPWKKIAMFAAPAVAVVVVGVVGSNFIWRERELPIQSENDNSGGETQYSNYQRNIVAVNK